MGHPPISREHLERAAAYAGVPGDKIDETVRSLSAHLGWDIAKGAGGNAEWRTAKAAPRTAVCKRRSSVMSGA